MSSPEPRLAVCECSLTWGNEREREGGRGEGLHACMHAWLKLVYDVNDNRKRCHIERLLGLLCQVCLSPPCLEGDLITLPYNYPTTKGSVKVPVK